MAEKMIGANQKTEEQIRKEKKEQDRANRCIIRMVSKKYDACEPKEYSVFEIADACDTFPSYVREIKKLL